MPNVSSGGFKCPIRCSTSTRKFSELLLDKTEHMFDTGRMESATLATLEGITLPPASIQGWSQAEITRALHALSQMKAQHDAWMSVIAANVAEHSGRDAISRLI